MLEAEVVQKLEHIWPGPGEAPQAYAWRDAAMRAGASLVQWQLPLMPRSAPSCR